MFDVAEKNPYIWLRRMLQSKNLQQASLNNKCSSIGPKKHPWGVAEYKCKRVVSWESSLM